MHSNYFANFQFDAFCGENANWPCLLLETQTTNIFSHFSFSWFGFPFLQEMKYRWFCLYVFVLDSLEFWIICQIRIQKCLLPFRQKSVKICSAKSLSKIWTHQSFTSLHCLEKSNKKIQTFIINVRFCIRPKCIATVHRKHYFLSVNSNRIGIKVYSDFSAPE